MLISQQSQLQTAVQRLVPSSAVLDDWKHAAFASCLCCQASFAVGYLAVETGTLSTLIANRWLRSWNAAGLSTTVSLIVSVHAAWSNWILPLRILWAPTSLRPCVRAARLTSRRSRWTSCPCCVCWGRSCCPWACRCWMGAGWVRTSGRHRWEVAPWSRTAPEGDSCCTVLVVRCSAAPTDRGRREVKGQQQCI